MFPSRTDVKFQMIQDYRQKVKVLKLNLLQSQMLNKTLKQDLLKIGQQSNSLFIQISAKSNKIDELKSINPQKEKQLNYTREQLKRMEYKTQKHEIKLKEYEDRLKKFQDMYQLKKDKNQTLLDKISKIQIRLKEQKEKKTQIINEIKQLQPKKDPNNMPSLKIQSQYLKSISKKSNPTDDMQIQLLNTYSKIKKLGQQHQELKRKNNQLKCNINKLQQEIESIQLFMSSNSCIPNFIEDISRNETQNEQISQKNLRSSHSKDEQDQRILKYSDKFNLGYQSQRHSSKGINAQPFEPKNAKIQDRIRKPSNELPPKIASSISNYKNLKSKTMLDTLMTKHTEISENQHHMIGCLKQNSLLMNEMTELNSILESQIAHQNSKLCAFNIRNKKYAQLQQRAIS